MKAEEVKNISFERVLFFSDAVVAIAITLLALDLKIEIPNEEHLTFSILFSTWHLFAAFLLSFINIASFWRNHHDFFSHIKKIDERILFFNIAWLFFIVTLPFSTKLVSSHYTDTPAIFTYCLNILLIAVFQNLIWDYSFTQKGFIDKENLTENQQRYYRMVCNLEMLNAVIALVISFFNPLIAFVFLFFKVPVILIAGLYNLKKKKIGTEYKK